MNGSTLQMQRRAMNNPRLPLSNIRIADFGWMIAGPLATRVFANFGAEVIRIESGSRIDEIRVVGARPEGIESPNVAGVFNDINTSKLSMTLDLNTDEGLSLAKNVIEISDVVTNNFRGDRMGKWGLDYDNLKKIKPDIIALSMPMMGSDGPHQDYGGNGINIIAGAGISSITGYPDKAPVGTGSLYPDFSGNPNHASIALLAAIRYRNRTGKGQFIDLAQYESTVSLLGTSILEYTANGKLPDRPGNRSQNMAPHNVYRCKGMDRWCAIAVSTEEEWQNLKKVLGELEWMNQPKFANFNQRKANEEELDEGISNWTSNKDAYEVMNLLQSHGVPAGVVQDTEDLLKRDKSFTDTHVIDMPHPEIDSMKVHGETISMSGVTPKVDRAPLLGEHTEYILGDLLGVAESKIDDLYVSGVLK